jgi:microcystin-dependent protein
MGTPFMGELRIVSFTFPPQGWAFANGQLLPINQNQALFSLFGTQFGGDGRTNFAIPNLQGRVPIHRGNQFTIMGEKGGQAAHTLTISEMPQHFHFAQACSDPATTGTPDTTTMLAKSTPQNLYASPANLVPMAPNSVSSVGGNQPHTNLQPYLVLNFCVALQGIFPSQN